VHVCDLVDAHVLGLKWLQDDKGSRLFNLGTGKGFSVREVLDESRAVTNKEVPHVEGDRRPGDCTKLVSGSERAVTELGWTPARSNMKTMIEDAWNWHQTGHYDK
jgi:UDP-glucose 4-epimerase